MHTYTPADSIFDGPATYVLSVLHFDRNPVTCSCDGEKKDHNDFKLGTFIGRFQSDGAASMAAKGLMLHCHLHNDFCIKVGSDESRFNASLLIAMGKFVSTDRDFLKTKERQSHEAVSMHRPQLLKRKERKLSLAGLNLARLARSSMTDSRTDVRLRNSLASVCELRGLFKPVCQGEGIGYCRCQMETDARIANEKGLGRLEKSPCFFVCFVLFVLVFCFFLGVVI